MPCRSSESQAVAASADNGTARVNGAANGNGTASADDAAHQSAPQAGKGWEKAEHKAKLVYRALSLLHDAGVSRAERELLAQFLAKQNEQCLTPPKSVPG